MSICLDENVIILGMVGLPARGKSYTSRKLCRFLEWIGYKPKIFNVGNYRRNILGVNIDFDLFFDPKNNEAIKSRDECALEALKDIKKHINIKEINIAILDATNTTINRRELVKNYLKDNLNDVNYVLIWIENICNISDIIYKNIVETKLKSADYVNWSDKEKAIASFNNRIKLYEQVYETINQEKEGDYIKYIKVIDQGKKLITNNIYGYLESKLVSYLINLHTGERSVYFTRHGESEYNLKNMIGGDCNLSEKGKKFAKVLAKYFENEFAINKKPKLYCSTLKRAIETTQILIDNISLSSIKFPKEYTSQKMLDEICVGSRDSLTYDYIKNNFPKEYDERKKDKLNYRYPRGESYMDIIKRIEPMIYEIERSQNPLIIVGHQAMLRCLYGYFNNTPIQNIPYIEIPLHTVIKFSPKDYGFFEERYYLNPTDSKITKLNLISEVRMEDS